ncbi:hypothetical protein ACHQM5_006006 [Ranunculus cassubicifolius]
MDINGNEEFIMENNDVSITIGDNLLADHILSILPERRSSPGFIYRVPASFRLLNEEKYEPHTVSIGPYHHGKENLKIAENYKNMYLQDVLERTTTPQVTMRNIIQGIRMLEEGAREFYAEPINATSDEFVTMMVLDGCFILELLCKFVENHCEGNWTESRRMSPIVNKDPIFSTTWMSSSCRRDLMLLENQLPFPILECLYDLTRDPRSYHSLNYLVVNFFLPKVPEYYNNRGAEISGRHILDILRNHLLPSSEPRRVNYANRECTQFSLSDICGSGVTIVKKQGGNGLLDVTFRQGRLEIPPFYFETGLRVLLPNLIALEQCRRDYTDQITSYAILLDSLINSEEDVKILRDEGIINVNWLEDELIATEINIMCKGLDSDKFNYGDLCSRINRYCRTDWNRWKATLKRNYFNTPWSAISFVAATGIVLFTAADTSLSALYYYGFIGSN